MLFVDPQTVESVLTLYCLGAAVEDICDCLGPTEVNSILDVYAPLL